MNGALDTYNLYQNSGSVTARVLDSEGNDIGAAGATGIGEEIMKNVGSFLIVELMKQGYTPDIILGDLDSLSDKNKIEHTDTIIETPDQSQNDLRKAINYAKDHNIKFKDALKKAAPEWKKYKKNY